MTALASLYVDGNEIVDVAPLAKVTRINVLDLRNNQIKDVAPVAKQTDLRMLLLDMNKVEDLATLVTAAKADSDGDRRWAPYLRLYLKGNPLSEKAKKEQLPKLKEIGVRVEGV